jgi:glucose/arabinose dehydrogenase
MWRTGKGSTRAAPGLPTTLALASALALAATTAPAIAATCDGIAPVAGTTLSAFPVVTGLNGTPLLVTAPPGDLDRIFVVEQAGVIRYHLRGDPTSVTSVFLDISARVQLGGEMGLLGLAFDPDYEQNGYFYVNYTEGPSGGPWFTVVARYSRSGVDPFAADPTSELRILRFAQPEENHNGGQVMFGPDGFLYVATGDGGGGNDQHGVCGNGQDRATLLGKMLRLDVRDLDPASVPPDCGGVGSAYRVPSDNPFALTGTSDCGEIWLYGLRNPWRSGFDTATGDLYLADVGQQCWEEVNVLPAAMAAGANLGWRQMEGNHCFSTATPFICDPAPVTCATSPACEDPSLVLPVEEYGHEVGCSIIGGPVYHGCQMPDVAGTYFYGDLCTAFVKSFRFVGGAVTEKADRSDEINPTGLLGNLTSFGTDGYGEIYAVSYSGLVLRIGPPFTALEVSARGAGKQLELDMASWTWEDLTLSTDRPVAHYRIYRGTPGGAFACIANAATPVLAGGDPSNPPLGGLYAYVVTAVSPTGEETRPGIAGTSFQLAGCQ